MDRCDICGKLKEDDEIHWVEIEYDQGDWNEFRICDDCLKKNPQYAEYV